MKPASVICAVFLSACPATLAALPLNCVADTESAPFLAQLQRDGALNDVIPAQQTFRPLVSRAREVLLAGARPDIIQRGETKEVVKAALGCLHRSSATSDPDETRKALLYLAVLALSRAMTDPQHSEGAVLRAERLLELTRGGELRSLKSDERYKSAAAIVTELHNTAMRILGTREDAALPIRERVDRYLAQVMVPGSVRMEQHLENLYEPIQQRLDLLVSIALTRESARGMIETSIAEPVDEELTNQMLSNPEQISLMAMRDSYAELYPRSAAAKLRDGASERLLRLRTTLEMRGVDADRARGFCMGNLGQIGCLDYDSALFAEGGTYSEAHALDAMVPLAQIDAELRSLVAEVLFPFVSRYEDIPPGGSAEDLRRVKDFLTAVATSESTRRPKEVDGYIMEAGVRPLRPELFEMEGERPLRVDLCNSPPEQAEGLPRFGAGSIFIEQAVLTAEKFSAPDRDPDGSLGKTCELLRELVEEIKVGPE